MESTQWKPGELRDMQKGIGEEFIPVFPFVCCSLPEHRFEGVVETLNQTICLGVVGGCLYGLYAKKVVDFLQELRCEVGSLVCEDFLGNTDTCKDLDELSGNTVGFNKP